MNAPRSPILTLENAIAGCAFRIAPERNHELAEFRDSRHIKLSLVDERDFNIRVLLDKNEVIIGIAALEFLWASCHAQLVIYHEYGLAQQSDATIFDTGGSDRRLNAMKLLNWAGHNIQNSGKELWPADLPQPVRYPVPLSDIHAANELFLCAIAWIIHHELAHLRLNHQALSSPCTIVEEKDADLEATKWILDKCTDSKETRKRTYGIAAAILALQGFQNEDQFVSLKTHPSTFERIDYCLTAANIDDDDEIYAFSAVTMQIQLAHRGIHKSHAGSSFRELYSEYLIEFSKASS